MDMHLQGHRKRLQRMWRQMPFAASSPFHHSRGHDNGYVIAFEIEWGNICGMDYSNPLCQDGRMVLEAMHVVKREFLTVRCSTPAPDDAILFVLRGRTHCKALIILHCCQNASRSYVAA